MSDLFYKSLLKGIENATNVDKFLIDVSNFIDEMNTELQKVLKYKSASRRFEFMYCDELYVNIYGLPKREINKLNFVILLNLDGKYTRLITANITENTKYKIKYLSLDDDIFPNIDKFKDIFSSVLESSFFGELIHKYVKL